MNHQKYFSYSFCYNPYKLWLSQWLFSDCVFINHLTCQRCMRKFIIFHLQNKLSPSHLLMLHPSSSPPTSDYIGREMEQFCDPRHFLDLSDHIRPISMQGRNAKEMDGKMEMACKEMNEQKIFALARIVRRTQLSFKEEEIEIFFFFSCKNLLHFRIVCLNAGCKDLLVWKVWRVLNLHILKTNAHSFQLSKRISWR